MGRELRRVPLDFDWPMNEIWKGYINPHWKPCPEDQKTCFNGQTAAGEWMDAICRFISLTGEQAAEAARAAQVGMDYEAYEAAMTARGSIFPHPYLKEFPMAPWTSWTAQALHDAPKKEPERSRYFYEESRRRPSKILPLTPELQLFVENLAGKEYDGFPMSNGVSWEIQKRFRKIAKLPKDWGTCQVCKGEHIHPDVLKDYEAWKPEPPPKGEGYQLWETTSEGSPVSPVFASLDELCAWCEDNATTFGKHKTSAAEWKRMLDDGFVCHREGNAVFI